MSHLSKRILVGLGLLLLCVLLYAGYIYRNLKIQSAAAEKVRAEQEVTFKSQLAEYQSALPVGTPRSEVIQDLQSRGVQFGHDRTTIIVNLGQEPGDGLVCDRWYVDASFEFTQVSPEEEPSAHDLLRVIALKRVGHCS